MKLRSILYVPKRHYGCTSLEFYQLRSYFSYFLSFSFSTANSYYIDSENLGLGSDKWFLHSWRWWRVQPIHYMKAYYEIFDRKLSDGRFLPVRRPLSSGPIASWQSLELPSMDGRVNLTIIYTTTNLPSIVNLTRDGRCA